MFAWLVDFVGSISLERGLFTASISTSAVGQGGTMTWCVAVEAAIARRTDFETARGTANTTRRPVGLVSSVRSAGWEAVPLSRLFERTVVQTTICHYILICISVLCSVVRVHSTMNTAYCFFFSVELWDEHRHSPRVSIYLFQCWHRVLSYTRDHKGDLVTSPLPTTPASPPLYNDHQPEACPSNVK